jgi:hypothetical protein
MYYERKIRLYEIDELRKLYTLNFMDLEKIYMDCGGKYFPYILIIGGALEAPSYRNRDALPGSAPFYKKGVLACKHPLFKKKAFSCHKAPPFFKKKNFKGIFQ